MQHLFHPGETVETHSLQTTVYNWQCGKVRGFQNERIRVDFGPGRGEKALKPANLRHAVSIPPRSFTYSLVPEEQKQHRDSRLLLRCFSTNCPYTVNSDSFFGSFCCKRCYERHAGIPRGLRAPQHGRYCQGTRAIAASLLATTTELLISGGGLLEVWRILAALSLCRGSASFNSLEGAGFRAMIFMHFVPPNYYFKPKPWPHIGLPEHARQAQLADHEHGSTCIECLAGAICDVSKDESLIASPIPEVVEDVAGDDWQDVEAINPQEAAQITEEQWASSVERNIELGTHMDITGSTPSEEHVSRESLVVLTFGRHPREFDRALMESELAQTLSSHEVIMKPDWAHGAKIMARGVSASMFEALTFDLGVKNVVVAIADEHRIYDALQVLPYSQRPRVKATNGRLLMDCDEDVLERFRDISDDESSKAEPSLAGDTSEYLPVRRTFIHFSSASASTARTVSTSQMRNLSIGNPRSKAPR